MSLYTKYRPKDWDSIVWQDAIVSILRQAIKTENTGHAYIFTGSRGTGKTSSARIFAKAINCLNPQNWNPCHKCEHCQAFENNNFIDIIELDAASHTGVDNMREMIEAANFGPVQGKYKIYIIDEVHMLSKGAFNALLKTLEEPPTHVKFILATTEIHKVPETIQSRAQRFDFRKISVEDIIGRLEFIAKNENIEAEKEALELIAEQARGGMRDAITLFEQFSSSGTVTLKTLETELSLISKKTLQEIIQAIGNQDKKWLEDILEKLKSEHINARNFFDSILYILRDELRVHLEHSNFQKYQNITEIFIKNYNSIRNFSDEMLLIEITLYQAFWSVTLWEHQIEIPKVIPNIKPQFETKTEWTIQNNLETKTITPKAEKTNITEERHENTQEIEATNTEIQTEKSFHFVQFINACKKHAPIFLPLKSATFDRNENNLCLKTASKWNYNILNDEKNKVIMKQILTETFGGDDWNISVQISDNHQSQVAAVDEIF